MSRSWLLVGPIFQRSVCNPLLSFRPLVVSCSFFKLTFQFDNHVTVILGVAYVGNQSRGSTLVANNLPLLVCISTKAQKPTNSVSHEYCPQSTLIISHSSTQSTRPRQYHSDSSDKVSQKSDNHQG